MCALKTLGTKEFQIPDGVMYVPLDETGDARVSNIHEEEWIDFCAMKLKNILISIDRHRIDLPQSLAFFGKYRSEIVHTSASDQFCRILDFGGAVGHHLPALRVLFENEGSDARIQFDVIDNEGMCNRGKRIFADNEVVYSWSEVRPLTSLDEIAFYSDPEKYEGKFDIFMCTAAFMFINDLTDVLTILRNGKPKYIFFSYFLANYGTESVKVTCLYHDNQYYEVTAHSIDYLKSYLENIGYKEIESAGFYNSDEFEDPQISESLRQLHPGIRNADLYFVHETP